MTNNDRDHFMAGLDLHQPDWWMRFADQNELCEFVYDSEERRMGRERAEGHLRRNVALRLMMPVRAAVEAGLVRLP